MGLASHAYATLGSLSRRCLCAPCAVCAPSASWSPVGAWYGLVWAPPDREMGDVQRIMYVHVPAPWMALMAVTLNFVCSVAYLLRPRWSTDALAEASAEVGLLLRGDGPGAGQHLGQAHLGRLLELGPPPHQRGHPPGGVRRLPGAAALRRRRRAARGLVRGGGHHHRRRHPHHLASACSGGGACTRCSPRRRPWTRTWCARCAGTPSPSSRCWLIFLVAPLPHRPRPQRARDGPAARLVPGGRRR